MQKDQSNRYDLNKLMLEYYNEETIFAAKTCLHEKLNKPGGHRLNNYQGLSGGKKNLEDMWDGY